MKKLLIGIDLGTTYTCASILNDAGSIEVVPNGNNGAPTIPSVMLLKKDQNPSVGNGAKSAITGLISLNKDDRDAQMKEGWYLKDDGSRAVIEQTKRFISSDKQYNFQEEAFNPTTVSAAILKKITQNVEKAFGQKIDKAVITVPANFNSQQRQETLKAANSIGMNVTDLIDEPTAAALAYSVSSQIDGVYVIYDFGGGTFDCSVVETKGDNVKILASDGAKRLGGKDLDLKLLNIVEKKYKEITGKDLSPRQYSIIKAEESKVALSTEKEIDIFIDGHEIIITRKEFEEAISTLVAKSILVFDNAIDQAKISVDNIMDVILVGGTSRTPLIKKMLKKKIGKSPKNYGNPDETVAKGAAIYIALKNKESLNINQKAVVGAFDIKEITNVYLGTIVISENGPLRNRNLIKKGQRIPAQTDKTFYIPGAVMSEQLDFGYASKPLEAEITESYSNSSSPDKVSSVWTKEVDWPLLTRSIYNRFTDDYTCTTEWGALKYSYSIDENQIFHIKIIHTYTGKVLVDENLDMRKGSLNIKAGSKNKKIDSFTID